VLRCLLVEREGDDVVSDWRPIETYDKSAVVIVWDDYYFMRFARYDFRRNLWITDLPYDDERGGVELPLNPTHWIPAPFPPNPTTFLDKYFSDPMTIGETKITDPID
jgi:hypothetical protein